ncbi:hypothetical protein [Citreicella sp. C3M06]|uniref:hypothetical protein n=1 Tax=Citreicella sp. C3M06 TaxID=2841564 RepID=UPI001C0A50C1|nr:hypothetical protein [Citreicella sp. C3M06]
MQDEFTASVAPEMPPFVASTGTQPLQIASRLPPAPAPDHTSLVIDSDAKQRLITGAAMNHDLINFAHPDRYKGLDIYVARTVTSRRHLLDMAATGHLAVSGHHFPISGAAHATRQSRSYCSAPSLWTRCNNPNPSACPQWSASLRREFIRQDEDKAPRPSSSC